MSSSELNHKLPIMEDQETAFPKPESELRSDDIRPIDQSANIPAPLDEPENLPAALEEFTFFPKLTIELRLRIWNFAIPPPQTIVLLARNGYTGEEHRKPGRRYLAFRTLSGHVGLGMFTACHESREEVTRKGLPFRLPGLLGESESRFGKKDVISVVNAGHMMTIFENISPIPKGKMLDEWAKRIETLMLPSEILRFWASCAEFFETHSMVRFKGRNILLEFTGLKRLLLLLQCGNSQAVPRIKEDFEVPTVVIVKRDSKMGRIVRCADIFKNCGRKGFDKKLKKAIDVVVKHINDDQEELEEWFESLRKEDWEMPPIQLVGLSDWSEEVESYKRLR
ncbi:hypothetical protein BDZ45DRAFT_754867 [Acephala macrosclerotiorum]|nr:hypothetical protein BDZ45DRAFT_754867 [Acephala macrosclerotiorum]